MYRSPSAHNHRIKRLIIIRLSLCLLFLSAVCAPLCAQQTTGMVQGKIQDQAGAVLAGAKLELVNLATNLTFQQTGSAEGTYVFNFVPPGSYKLRATVAGFKASEISGVNVEINKSTVIDFTLEPGAVTETVSITAGTEQVDTTSAALKTNINSKTILELPLSSRNPLAVAEMAPGVDVQTGGLTGGSQMLNPNGITANVSGGRQQQNSFYLDGADNSGALRNTGLQMPNPEAIQEVQVVTSTNSAEFGKQPGGYFNVITKSGTNEFHGSAFFFGNYEGLNTNEWARNASGHFTATAPEVIRGEKKVGEQRNPRPAGNLRQYGGTLGGPIIKSKTFFFGSYQRYQDAAARLRQNIKFATSKMIAGDFSEFAGQLYYPNFPDIPANLRNQPIPNNNLAAAGLLDPVAINIAKLLPTVPRLGDRLSWEWTEDPRTHETLGKVDHNFSQAHRVSFNFFRTWGGTTVETATIPNYATGRAEATQLTLSGRHTWTMSANRILETQFAMAQHRSTRRSLDQYLGRDLAAFGARNWPEAVVGAPKTLPNIEISNSAVEGFNGSPIGSHGLFNQDNFRVSSNLTWTRGAHNFKAGFEAQRSAIRAQDARNATQFRFQGRFSNRGNQPGGATANALFAHSFADFMMGRIENFALSGKVDYELPTWSYYAFAQDQWRITPRLTITPGVRYEIYQPAREVNGKTSSFIENHRSSQYPNAPLHIAFQGDAGIPDGFYEQDRNNFAPRIHVAYDVLGNGKLALRGGYGLYYAFPALQINQYSAVEFPQVPNVQGSQARLIDPWLTSQAPTFTKPPVPFETDHTKYLQTYQYVFPTPRIIGFAPDFTTPHSHQWNFTAESEVRGGMVVSAAYVGNRGRNLLLGFPNNYARFKNTPDGQPPSNDINNIIARVPYPQLSRFIVQIQTIGEFNYDSLQLASTAHFGKDLFSRFTYTWAPRSEGNSSGVPDFTGGSDEDPTGFTAMTDNPANIKGEIGRRGPRHLFRAFYVYELPFLRGGQSLVNKIAGGWQLSGNVTIRSGNPFNVIVGSDLNFDAITSRPQDRPDLVGKIKYTSGADEQKMAGYFNKDAFAIPTITAQKLFGNLPRNALTGPGAWFADLALAKNFAVKEGMRIQVRLEAYNFLNHPILGQPVGQMNSPDFTKILNKSGNRTMQYALKFYF
jgi:outer membrane receptor protein involved in Fe transport